MLRRALILCSIALVGCASGAAGSAPETTTSTTRGTTETTVEATTTSRPATTSTASSTTSTTSTSSTTSTTTTVATVAEPTTREQAVLDLFTARAYTLMSSDVRAISVAVARGDAVIGRAAYGLRPDGSPLEPDAPFRIASISKVLTATLVLQLVDQGRLALDDSLSTLGVDGVGAADPRVGDVTVRQLLGHTSGIGKLRPLFFGATATDWRATARVALAGPLVTPPGAAYAYSNANYAVLGLLVEQLTGLPFDTAVRQQVLEPLGVTAATLSPSTGVIDPDGPAYVVNPSRRYMEALGPAGAWVISADDLLRLIATLQPDSVRALLRPATLAQMRTPTSLVDDEPDWSYGLGLMVFPWAAGHTGTIEDVRTFALALPSGYSVVVLGAGRGIASGEDLITAFGPELLNLAALAKS